TVTLKDFEKTEATTDAEGSLRGTVAVASSQDSSVTDSVELDRTIPKLPESGSVIPEVKPGENAPAADISTPKAELEEMLLTDTEKQQVQDGTDIRIILEIQDAGNTVSTADQTNIEQASNGYSVGQYLNIDLYKLVGENRTDITETAKKIRIVIAVPDSLKTADSSQIRAFAVIRVHDGTAELLADLDDSADTVTIETDRFSTYAIIYQDKPDSGDGGNNEEDNNGGGNSDDNNGGGNSDDNNGGGNSDDNNGGDNGNNNGSNNSGDGNNASPNKKDSEPKTGDAMPIELYATLAMIAGFTYLLLYFTDRKRGMTEETKKEFVTRLVGWAKRGGRLRKCLALAAIFILLVYYHSIGKKTCAEVEWKNAPMT
ncbi:MAG: sortase B protein-sorting domain-containing protein, partial [bacterium]|nr:sortase B protein-sorting domain-containing protein [bacterium]